MTSATDAVRQCVFCPNDFDPASDKDENILEIAQALCTNCNQNLIQIGRKLYAVHNAVNCESGTSFRGRNGKILTNKTVKTNGTKYKLRSQKKNIHHVEIKTEVVTDNEEEESGITQNHILSHFIQETCEDCNQNLIRIGVNLYALHNSDTCATQSNDRNESCLTDQTLEANEKNSELKSDENKICHIEIKTEVFSDNEEGDIQQNGHGRSSNKGLSSGQSRFECGICCNEFSHQGALRRHLIIVHRARGDSFCKVCARVFEAEEELAKHMPQCILKIRNCNSRIQKRQPGEKKFKCDECGLGYSAKWLLKQHQKFVHLNVHDFMCNICGEVLKTNDELVCHMNRHTGDKSYKCTYDGCDKGFQTRSGRDSHVRIHTGKKPYQCKIEECEERFFDNKSLKKHKETVHGIFIKTFTCTMCDEKFPKISLLKKHVKSHDDTPKQPKLAKKRGRKKKLFCDFMCNVCGEIMKRSDQLVCHMNRHTGNKSYKCTDDECEKEFRTRSGRDTHVRIHHTGIKSHQCKIDECNEGFSHYSKLKRHKETVHGIFLCTVCGENLPNTFLLEMHTKLHDNTPMPPIRRGRKRKLFLSDLIGFYNDDDDEQN